MKNKVVVITGASSGIGKACAKYFASKGAKVALGARNKDKLDAAVEEIRKEGGEAIAVPTDVAVQEDCKNLIEKTVEAFGGVDVLINNAGISMRALFKDTEISVIEKVMQVNFWGTVYCTKYALPYLLKSKGSVVGVSSIAGYVGLPARTGYSASKYAMQGFLDALRSENRDTGLHVLIACPGFTASNIRNTALTGDGNMQGESPREEQKMMQPEEVARYIYRAIKKRKRRIILTSEGKWAVYVGVNLPKQTETIAYKKMLNEPDSPLKKKK